MLFSTKKELLEYRGKNGNDNKLVDRWILRGEVVMEDGMFRLVDKDAIIEELENEIKNLREQQGKNTLTTDSEWANESGKNTLQGNNTLLERVKELESDLEYVNWEYEKMEAKLINYQEAIRNCYKWARDVKKDKTPRPSFKKDILKLEEDIKWEDNQ